MSLGHAQGRGLARCDRRELYRYRQFYLIYPRIVESLPPQWLPAALAETIVEPPAPESLAGKKLLESLSFTHLAELLQIDDPQKRGFYEAESIRGNWSVRELKRQIASLYYERSALSTDKAGIAELTQTGAEIAPAFPIRDPYVFEFLVTGAGKREAVARWKNGEAIPAAAIRCANGIDVLLDAAAWAEM